MSFIEWNNDLSVGIDELDSQHKKWISIINELHDAMKSGKTNSKMSDILEKMRSYIEYHFSYEENFLNGKGYPGLPSHKLLHSRYATNFKKISDEYLVGKMLLSLDIMNSMKDWLTSHIMSEDKKYGTYFKNKL